MRWGNTRSMKPDEIEEQEQDSERFWKTPNTLDAEGLQAAAGEPQPEDVGHEGLGQEHDPSNLT